ncbi:ubiquinol-cytochrome c reductase subunit 7 [Trypanosoma rangeli]|uniref:Ubiquinol-cytochrome c reductase subunit 7 n=1 Tax=Trypanosoma rangeli TaxID=5698 RepID=A0A3R7N7A2_TRYRA|nr:ubiquinol-cytochrome c reductase subunit 7 [Trypanosoma rangeli]RNF01459.1 ubiquinol-cytochrome c reductase subunit 7 [Trypanosoma rangeli]|eukprot:RNF01459.1 ubiquinol-cytochrome c reductase subunit 7 [Trypanosoma rangeli]
MMRPTAPRYMAQGIWAGFRYYFGHFFYPNMYREFLSVQNAHKVERALRIQSAIKANKVDYRALLALPVTDHAHPYKMEYPWEKVIHTDYRDLSMYGKWYASKIMCFYEGLQYHKYGCLQDDLINAHGWWNRAARTRAPQDKVIHGDRRVMRARVLRDKYIYEPKSRWVHPIDNVAYFGPYVMMVCDEWEEKWGFFAGQEVEY